MVNLVLTDGNDGDKGETLLIRNPSRAQLGNERRKSQRKRKPRSKG
jgi:hypothetical protein